MTSPTPEILWHYTDASGLYGIISSSRLRFGDAGFLNDRTERAYGARVLAEEFDRIVSADSTDMASRFRELTRVMRLRDRLYVCSLSANRESLSQWQRYGADGNGYCISFDTRKLDEVLGDDRVSRHEMVYDEAKQREMLRDAISSGLEQYRKLERDRRGSGGRYYDYLFTDMDIRSAELQMKHPLFHDEHEWRYFVTSDDEDDDFDVDEVPDAGFDGDDPDVQQEPKVLFAPRGNYVKPFLELPATRANTDKRLPIMTVVCGPRLDKELVVGTVKRFLRSCGYNATVEHSSLAEIWR